MPRPPDFLAGTVSGAPLLREEDGAVPCPEASAGSSLGGAGAEQERDPEPQGSNMGKG